MEAQVSRLVDKVWDRYLETPDDVRVLIAIAGIPGSGKTHLAHAVAKGLNKKAGLSMRDLAVDVGKEDLQDVAIAVPMDGFHLTRAQLAAMPDPENAFARRGAEFTFDGAAFARTVEYLRKPIEKNHDGPGLLLPAFDHAVKDPVPDQIVVGPRQRIVLFEGNYVCLDKAPWNRAASAPFMDERWVVEVDFAVARKRLIQRHLAAGIAANEQEAARRADENDLVNGREIVENKVSPVEETIFSQEDASWR
ncbi:hypothetical protein SEPCBS57363_004160 [Sporothrix epigloea]|uniref:Phosphoribulokinase/uridine kinase domain-containing protein n=1 Tax=Sporothrix epigloea TaxID=1892477 RepID=A0ABP0DSM0_9PEZI